MQPEPEDEGFGSADEVEQELGGGVSEALAEFKSAIGRAGEAPTLGKVDGWRVALTALSLVLAKYITLGYRYILMLPKLLCYARGRPL